MQIQADSQSRMVNFWEIVISIIIGIIFRTVNIPHISDAVEPVSRPQTEIQIGRMSVFQP